MQAEFHPICSSHFVTRIWSDALAFENASHFLPMDIRATLSAQFQLLSSLCSIAQQIVDDELNNFLAIQFITTDVIANNSLRLQVRDLCRVLLNKTIVYKVDVSTSSFQNSISSSLSRSLEFIRQTSLGNRVSSAIGLSSINYNSTNITFYNVFSVFCANKALSTSFCSCLQSYGCKIPAGIYNVKIPDVISTSTNCIISVSTNTILTIFDNFYVGCLPIESLLLSSLTCLYKVSCLQTLNQYLSQNITQSPLTLPFIGQFNEESTLCTQMDFKCFVRCIFYCMYSYTMFIYIFSCYELCLYSNDIIAFKMKKVWSDQISSMLKGHLFPSFTSLSTKIFLYKKNKMCQKMEHEKLYNLRNKNHFKCAFYSQNKQNPV